MGIDPYSTILKRGPMKLQEIIIVRHADFSNAREEVAISQGEALADRLEPIIGPLSTIILTSTVKRAWLTAKPICRKFGIRHYTESDILRWLEDADRVKAPRALELIDEYAEKADALVVITHADYLKWLPEALAEKYLGIVFTGGDRGYAQGWVIDIKGKTIEPI